MRNIEQLFVLATPLDAEAPRPALITSNSQPGGMRADQPPRHGRHTESVARVQSALRGKRLVIIGGDRRPMHMDRLKKAFDLWDVHWIETSDSDASVRRIAPKIKARSADLVVILIGLVRHNHALQIPRLCEQIDRPLVRYRGRSPHPNGLADAIIEQASQHLGLSRNVRRSSRRHSQGD